MVSTTQRDHLTAARERLAQMTTELRASASWQAMLRMQQSFHTYSLNNVYLIACQCPHASYLKGLKGWLELGRCVRKGEKAIRIMAPRPYAVPTVNGDGNQSEERRLTFAMVSVFDYSQSDPVPDHPLPFTLPARISVTGDQEAARAAYAALVAHLAAEGVPVTNHPPRDTERGAYSPRQRSINVCPDAPPRCSPSSSTTPRTTPRLAWVTTTPSGK